jgi:hypothetical protein
MSDENNPTRPDARKSGPSGGLIYGYLKVLTKLFWPVIRAEIAKESRRGDFIKSGSKHCFQL